ncbi:MAG: BTAD domain-containing putative transcriptional regulator [Jatrophihabitans sp.]
MGDVEVLCGKIRLPVRAQRQRTIIAILLLNANRVVPIDQLIDAVWEDDPPATARSQAQICISALRRLLARHGAADLLETRETGYLLRVAPEALDVSRFDRLVAAARASADSGDLETAAQQLTDALALWRGPAMSGVAERWGALSAAWLNETRLGAQEDLFEIQANLGRHHAIIADLTRHLNENPLRERPRAQLMIALHRCGRQPEALEVYRVGRLQLIDQLAIEPSPMLRDLEHAILSNDSSLVLPEQAPRQRPSVSTGEPAAHQLPADIADFTGRTALLVRIAEALNEPRLRIDRVRQASARVVPPPGRSASAVPVVVLVGRPGAGKSALAVHAAHLRSASDPDQVQLYADLRGSTDQPEDPYAVMAGFLVALGVSSEAIPAGRAAQAQLYRSLLAERPATVILDDAGSEEAVRDLLPGSSACVVIVTSRRAFGSLLGAAVLKVAELDVQEGDQLLATIIGRPRFEREAAAGRQLVEAVDCLPLGIRMIGAKLLLKTHWTLAELSARMVDGSRWLDELAVGELSVRRCLDSARSGLSEPARRLLGALTALDHEEVPAWVASAILDLNYSMSMEYLEELVDAQLVATSRTQSGALRYRLSGLNRSYAQQTRELDGEQARAVLTRVSHGWLRLAGRAYRSLSGQPLAPISLSSAAMESPHEPIVEIDPLGWLDRERHLLLEIVQQGFAAGVQEPAAELAIVLSMLLEIKGYPPDAERGVAGYLAAADT